MKFHDRINVAYFGDFIESFGRTITPEMYTDDPKTKDEIAQSFEVIKACKEKSIIVSRFIFKGPQFSLKDIGFWEFVKAKYFSGNCW